MEQVTNSRTKFSNNYIKYFTRKEKYVSITNSDNYYSEEINDYKLIKDLIHYDTKLSYQWSNFAYLLLFDYKSNEKFQQIVEHCFEIERKIMTESFDCVKSSKSIENRQTILPTEFYIIHKLLPILDSLSNDEVKIIKSAYLKNYLPHLISLNQQEKLAVESYNNITIDELIDKFISNSHYIPKIFIDLIKNQ